MPKWLLSACSVVISKTTKICTATAWLLSCRAASTVMLLTSIWNTPAITRSRKRYQTPTFTEATTNSTPIKFNHPRPPPPPAPPKNRGPVTTPPGRRISRADLPQTKRHPQGKTTADDPADEHLKPEPGAQSLRQGSNAARQNANDRKGNRKIGKSAHAPRQLLGIAHGMERLDILVQCLVHGISCTAEITPFPPSPTCVCVHW